MNVEEEDFNISEPIAARDQGSGHKARGAAKLRHQVQAAAAPHGRRQEKVQRCSSGIFSLCEVVSTFRRMDSGLNICFKWFYDSKVN